MGARLVLEMVRRGKAGAAVALDPGGFWAGWERTFLKTTLMASVWLLRGASPVLPALAHSAPGRTALLLQLSARPWALDGDLVESELKSFAATPTFEALVEDLAYGPPQQGPAADPGQPLIIGWGRHDRLWRRSGRGPPFRRPACIGSKRAGISRPGTSRRRRPP